MDLMFKLRDTISMHFHYIFSAGIRFGASYAELEWLMVLDSVLSLGIIIMYCIWF